VREAGVKLKPLREGVTLPDHPDGTEQLYWPEVSEVVQVTPLVPAKATPKSAEPPRVTVPLTVRSGLTVKLLLVAKSA